MSAKKKEQLGMSPGTANHKLTRDLLWNFIVQTGNNKCFQCGKEMTREDFSVEHKEPWLDSEAPIDNFFDIENIAYSHRSCNIAAGRRRPKSTEHGTDSVYRSGCRCEVCVSYNRGRQAALYTPEKRRANYERLGC